MKIVSFFSAKGGVGKTTLATLTAMRVSKENKKVLIIDADPQANITQFIHTVSYAGKTLFDALSDDVKAENLIVKKPLENYPNIDLIASDLGMSDLLEYMITKNDRYMSVFNWFRKNISVLKVYDYIFIDLSPSYDILTRNFLVITDSIITPLKYEDISSVRGCELFYQKYNQDLESMNIVNDAKRSVVTNFYTHRILTTGTRFNKYLDQFDNIKKDLLKTNISDTTFINNAIQQKMDIGDFLNNVKKSHRVKKEFNNYIKELKEREVL